MTAPGRGAGSEASDLGRFEPGPYDLGITGDPEPVPYSLTPAGEAALDSLREIGPYPASDDPEIQAAFSGADEAYGRTPGTAARLLAGAEITDPEAAFEAAAEVLDEWDSADSAAYVDRVEAGLEPEAEL